ncbi:unnamed protein product [Polarella glacialis]|nr:unnamed protein product [Polarella glacialis]
MLYFVAQHVGLPRFSVFCSTSFFRARSVAGVSLAFMEWRVASQTCGHACPEAGVTPLMVSASAAACACGLTASRDCFGCAEVHSTFGYTIDVELLILLLCARFWVPL